jgi:hypothetical protein
MRAAVFIEQPLGLVNRTRPAKRQTKEREPHQRRMPDRAVKAQRLCQLIDREEQPDRREEIKQHGGHAGPKKGDFTQHRIALLRTFHE